MLKKIQYMAKLPLLCTNDLFHHLINTVHNMQLHENYKNDYS